MQLALFDLDNTLLAGDSDFEWAQFLISKGVFEAVSHAEKNAAFLAQYQAGTLDIQAFLDFQLRPLSAYERAQLELWHGEFMRSRILPMISAQARALLQEHHAQGALCAIVTATNSFVTGPIARELGVTHLIATVAAQKSAESGQLSGQARGTPAFRDGKIVRVEAWLESLGLYWGSFTQSWFYSDSHNDLPLLMRVDHPVAVDPDALLRRHAVDAGWPILSLRAS
ncbi:MAG: HAD family hydrolase [Pseudomonadota bacterium]